MLSGHGKRQNTCPGDAPAWRRTIVAPEFVMEHAALRVPASAQVSNGILDVLLRDLEFAVLRRAQEHKLPTGYRQGRVGFIWFRNRVSPAALVVTRFAPHLQVPRVLKRFFDLRFYLLCPLSGNLPV